MNTKTSRLLLDPPPLAPSTVAAAQQEACRCRLSATVTPLCLRLTRLRVTTRPKSPNEVTLRMHSGGCELSGTRLAKGLSKLSSTGVTVRFLDISNPGEVERRQEKSEFYNLTWDDSGVTEENKAVLQ